MTKYKPLIFTAYDPSRDKSFEVTYYFDRFISSGSAIIWCSYDDFEELRLCFNSDDMKQGEKNFAWFYFHEPMYWLVLPLLTNNIISITRKTSRHCVEDATRWNNVNAICALIHENKFQEGEDDKKKES